MEIHICNRQSLLPVAPDIIQQIVIASLSREKVTCDEVSIYIVGADEISQLHLEHFGDSSVTDCISFPIDNSHDGGYQPLGDVFVCTDVAVSYAKTHPKTNPQRELVLYIIHGLLHLIGYDDIEDEDRAVMRLAEKRHLLYLQRHHLLQPL